jgi:transcriptional regulator with XRE-family HTH domain
MSFAHTKDQDGRPLPVNVHIGRRIRIARETAKLSQKRLGEKVGSGISLQQIQKYEKGESRVAVGTLLDIANATGRPIIWFFEGMPEFGNVA